MGHAQPRREDTGAELGAMGFLNPLLCAAAVLLAAQSVAGQSLDQGRPRNDLPQPYVTTRDWGQLPPGTARWAAVTAVEPSPDGSIYVIHRCFENSCAGRPEPPILKFDARGTLLKAWGEGMFSFPHGATVDRDGNLWVTDARGGAGKGHQVFKFSPEGQVLMTLGKQGVSGSGPELFDQPTDVVVASSGDIFVTDSHRNGRNNRVMRFAKDGRFKRSWGMKGSGRGEISEPHTIALDSRGRVFVGDRENNRIQIFDQEGKFLDEWRQFGRPSGISITADDRIYVADSESGPDTGAHELSGIRKGIRIGSARDGRVTAFIEDSESTVPDHSGAEGVGVDAQGNVYGAVVRRQMLERHVLAAPALRAPVCQVQPDWPRVPEDWIFGAMAGIATDSRDNVWVLHRGGSVTLKKACCGPAPVVMQFDPSGRLLQTWAGPGDGYEWPLSNDEHGIFVDHRDNVWIAGRGANGTTENQILKFDSRGRFLLQIGKRGRGTGSNDVANLGQPADIAVYPPTNEVFVADGYGNRRIVVFDADTGAYKRHWGAYGNKPDDAASRTTSNQGPGDPQFNQVHHVRISNDGLVYVADRLNRRIQIFTIDGSFVKEAFVRRTSAEAGGTVSSLAFSPGPEQRYLYVADQAEDVILILDRQTLVELGSCGRLGRQAGQFVSPHNIATDSKGNLYVAEDLGGARLQKFSFAGAGR